VAAVQTASRSLDAFVVCVCALAAAGAVGVWLLDGLEGPERPWLVVAIAALIALEHLYAAPRLARGRELGETHTHEESFFVAMALLTSPLMVLVAFGSGFLAGNVLGRRSPLKSVFNVALMVGAPAAGLLVFAALVTTALNRIAIAAVIALAGSGTLRRNLLDDLEGRAFVAAGDISLGVLVGFAANAQLWTLPFGLVALGALHYTLSGHVRARADQQKLADVVTSSSDGILSVAADGTIRSWNPASERITGHPASRVIGMSLGELETLLGAEPRELPGLELYGEGDAPAVLRITAADGTDRWVASTRAPLPEGGTVIVFRDETTRQQIDELLARAEAERLQADFVANVSHELRTPLTSILGFTKTLLADKRVETPHARYLRIIDEQSERLRALIDDLLDLRQIGGGQFTIRSEPVDLAALLQEQVTLFAPYSDKHTIVLDLPSQPLEIQGDAQRLKQVVANLLSNAIKYSPAGGEVGVSAAHRDGSVRVAVTDRGLGIPEDQQPDLFRRFFRVESERHRGIGGTGLGLALSREIVEAHGGEIGFESKADEGSTFYFDVPAGKV
jgi:PAS domain S-box-containing protein